MSLTPLLAALTAVFAFGEPDRPPPLTFDEHVDYIAWFNDLIIEGKSGNAYELYKGLLDEKGGLPGIRKMEGPAKEQFDQMKWRVWPAGEHPELAGYLQQCERHLDILKKGVKRRDYWQLVPPDTEMLLMVMRPYLHSCRTACEATVAQAWMKQDDQAEALIDACRVVLRNADHMQQGRTIINLLVGLAERDLAYEAARAALDEGVISGKNISRLYKTIRRYDPASKNRLHPYLGEWATQLDALQFLCPSGDLHAARWKRFLSAIDDEEPDETEFRIDIDPRATAKLIDEHNQAFMDIIQKPLTLKTIRALVRFEEERQSRLQKNDFIMIMRPSLTRSFDLQVRLEAARRGTLLVLVLHGHHAKHGKWPKSLKKIDEKLGIKGLSKLRRDPFSGKRFVYRLKGGEPLLYSVAADGKDDGGRHDKKWGEGDAGGDFVFWPHQGG